MKVSGVLSYASCLAWCWFIKYMCVLWLCVINLFVGFNLFVMIFIIVVFFWLFFLSKMMCDFEFTFKSTSAKSSSLFGYAKDMLLKWMIFWWSFLFVWRLSVSLVFFLRFVIRFVLFFVLSLSFFVSSFFFFIMLIVDEFLLYLNLCLVNFFSLFIFFCFCFMCCFNVSCCLCFFLVYVLYGMWCDESRFAALEMCMEFVVILLRKWWLCEMVMMIWDDYMEFVDNLWFKNIIVEIDKWFVGLLRNRMLGCANKVVASVVRIRYFLLSVFIGFVMRVLENLRFFSSILMCVGVFVDLMVLSMLLIFCKRVIASAFSFDFNFICFFRSNYCCRFVCKIMFLGSIFFFFVVSLIFCVM